MTAEEDVVAFDTHMDELDELRSEAGSLTAGPRATRYKESDSGELGGGPRQHEDGEYRSGRVVPSDGEEDEDEVSAE